MSRKFSLYALIVVFNVLRVGDCSIKQVFFRRSAQKYLENHVIQRKQTESELECSILCSRDKSCASINYKISGIGKGLCELNSKTVKEISIADGNSNNAEFKHLHKEKFQDPIQSSISTIEEPPSSCKELLERNRYENIPISYTRRKSSQGLTSDAWKRANECSEWSLSNGEFKLQNNYSLEQYKVYCHMVEIPGCGGGGWTLVMKMSGQEDTFSYHSLYWKNKNTYEVEDGLEGLTEKQTKLASYWNTPFTKVCLGMKVNGITTWFLLDQKANSLYHVIAEGNFVRATAGKKKWMSLIDNSSLQQHCNKEGFNVNGNGNQNLRIGIMANNEDDCDSCDSFIGFGASVQGCLSVKSTTCGNIVVCDFFNSRETPAFGYMLVQ